MEPMFVIFSDDLRNENIFKFFGGAITQVAHKMGFMMVSFEIMEIAIVDVFEVGTIDVTNLTLEMRTHFEMEFEGFQIVKSTIAKLANRMVENNFTSCTEITLLKMPLKLIVDKERLLGGYAAAVVEAHFTNLHHPYQN